MTVEHHELSIVLEARHVLFLQLGVSLPVVSVLSVGIHSDDSEHEVDNVLLFH